MSGSRASVLVLALWTLAVLGFLAVAVGGYVSANIRFATHLRQGSRAYLQARAGVEQAVSEIIHNATNYIPDSLDELISNEDLFKENRSVENGDFSVVYAFYDTNTATIVTNFGIFPESAKINVDVGYGGDVPRLRGILDEAGADAGVADNIFSNYPSEKGVAPLNRKRYFFYEAIPELLAVGGVEEDVYTALEPHVTIQRFRFYYRGSDSGEKIAREAYGGLSQGRAFVRAGDGSTEVAATRRIAFVFDRITTNFLHWREF
jgi:hypothetical protein